MRDHLALCCGRPGLLTVNIGDGLTRWTDGLLKSTYHRVRAPKESDPKVTYPDLRSLVMDKTAGYFIEAVSLVCSEVQPGLHSAPIICLSLVR